VIYADNASTTKISDTAFTAMLPFMQEQYGNASSQYSLGLKARRAVEQSRRQVANAIGATMSEIVFTSGGSEGNSWVLQGIVALYNEPIHIITTVIEHHSVLNCCRVLESQGNAITYLPVDGNGCVLLEDVMSALRPSTKLVSIMLANNEIGTIQPIAKIGTKLRERGVIFHTDAVQAIGHIPVDVNELQVDFLTASAHKFHGAKGVGFVYMRKQVYLPKSIFGGEQEHDKRGGTENVAGIVALGSAIEESVVLLDAERERISSMIQATINGIQSEIPDVCITGEHAKRLPGILNITLPGVSGESMMHLLDLKGICVSTSSACNAGKNKSSHVLLATGLTDEQAKSSIRISYGRYNTEEDVRTVISAICAIYKKVMTAKATGD